MKAQEALKKTHDAKLKKDLAEKRRMNKDTSERKAAHDKAHRNYFSGLVTLIEKMISISVQEGLESLHHYIQDREVPSGMVELDCDLEKHFRAEGYKIKIASDYPTSGGDPDSGEGATICGPPTVSMRISWHSKKGDAVNID